jgi:periplasmic divalent cation tolerance protein
MSAEAGTAGGLPSGAGEADPVLVSIAAPDGQTALRLARLLVEQHLAACVQVLDPIRSVYRWKGEVHEEPEALLLAKSSQGRLSRIHEFLRREHPYELPELVSVPITGGSPEYLRWIEEGLQ